MNYLTGLAQTTKTARGIAIVMGIISAESEDGFLPTQPSRLRVITARHLSWVNSAVLAGDPFVGPSDT
jgi:hypothetical protein